MSEHKVHFTVDTQILDELGKRLVSQDHIALAELIKNAYDADATRVEVEFIIGKKGEPQTIVITDNGSGMTFHDIQERWMRVATSDKIEHPISKRFGRPRTGSKGIGRFAVLRLSDELRLSTIGRTGRTLERTSINFDWGRLKRGESLNDLMFTALVTKSTAASTGLTLEFRKLAKRWTKRDITNLKRDLADLVAAGPTQRGPAFAPDPGIEVYFRSDLDDGEEPAQPLSEQLLDAGWGRLLGVVDSSGTRLDVSLKARYIGMAKHSFALAPPLQRLGSRLRIDISWYPQKPLMWSDRGVATSRTISDFLQHRSGVKIYLNGSRVFPYGERGDDWLGLEHIQASRLTKLATEELANLAVKLEVAQHRPMLDHPRAQRLIGRVDIEQPPDGPLTPTTDRMGFIENDAFAELKSIVQQAIQWMTLHYTRAKLLASEERASRVFAGANAPAEALLQDESAKPQQALRIVTRALGPGNSPVTLSADEAADVVGAAKLLASQAEIGAAKSEMMEQMASGAALLFVFSHEVSAILRASTAASNSISELAKSAQGDLRRELLEASRSIGKMTKDLRGLVGLVGLLAREARDDVLRPRSVEDAIRRSVEAFATLGDRYSISFGTHVQSGLLTKPMRAGALTSVVVNLVSNAVKAVIAGGRDRRIRVDAARTRDGLFVTVSDSGVGLQRQHWETVFEPLVTDPEKKLYPRLEGVVGDPELREFARGTGLGLAIVKSIVERSGGTVRFIEPGRSWTTRVEVQLP